MKLDRYKSELKKRNVIKPALAYLLVAWIIIQVASIVLPTFNAPPYVMKVILFVLSIGFLVWLIFSWVYEVTPEGIKKSSGIEQKKTIPLSSVNRHNSTDL